MNKQFNDLFENISNSFFGTIKDMYSQNDSISSENDQLIHILMKENRYMYLSLLGIFLILIYSLLF